MTDLRLLLIPLISSAVLCFFNYSSARIAKSYVPKGNLPLFTSRGCFFVMFWWIALRILFAYLSHRTENILSVIIVFSFALTLGFGLLLLLLPLLRKILSAESCATLWVIPIFLLLFSGELPRWCITLPFAFPSRQTVFVLLWIWLAGFAVVLLWSILTHLVFRHRLLKNASPVTDEQYQQVWQRQLMIANLPVDKSCLCMTPDTQTPLSIGLFWRTTYIVLPDQMYSPEELAMVLQHELIHISRRDSALKFIMTLYAAFMWFNPLSWIALRVCAQDLELSCDEAVLYGRPDQARKEYARLVLHTASSQLGYTSCLSASASSLRYRLKNIVKHRKRITGSIVIGFLCFAMLLGSMFIGVRYQAVPANTLLFTESDRNQLKVAEIFYTGAGVAEVVGECEKDQILLAYIATLSLQKTTEKPDVYSADRHMQIIIHAPDHNYTLTFGNGCLRVLTIAFSEAESNPFRWEESFYRLECDPDWKLLLSCIG